MHARGILSGFLLAAASCATGKLQLAVDPVPSRTVRLIAVYPTTLRFDAPAYRSFELSMDQVEALLATDRFLVLGPDEFERFDHQASSLYAGTDLSGKLTALGLKPGEVVALRTSVEQREQSSSRQRYDPKGRAAGHSRSAEITCIVHAELIGPDRGEPIASGTLEVTIDPFADHPPSDDAPELRQAVKTLATALLLKAETVLATRRQIGELPLGADWVPWNEEGFAMPGRPALRERLATLDQVSAEAERLLRLSYFEPDLSLDRQTRMLALPAGLWIQDAPRAWRRAGLEVGDLVTSVEGDPARGPQTLLRWISAKPAGAPVRLTVLRGDQALHLSVPSPDR